MGFGALGAGLCFLFNPNINVFDILPDFIGLWIVCAALKKLSQINSDISESRRRFFELSLVELAKSVSFMFISANDPTGYLLFAFVFGVVECILFTLAARELFIGVENLGMRHSSVAVLATKPARKGKVARDVSTRLEGFMLVFYYIRTLCAVLPEFTELQSDTVILNRRIILSQFKGIFYLLGGLIVTVLGIIYIKRVVAFFNSCRRDKPFIASLGTAYDGFLSVNKNYAVSGRMKLVLVMYAAAVLSTYNPTDDGLIKLPLFICGALLIVISILLTRRSKRALVALPFSGVMCVLSVIDFIKKDAFYSDNTKFEDIFHINEAWDAYLPINNLALIEYILLIVAFGVISSVIFRCAADDTQHALSLNSLTLKPNADEKAEIEGCVARYSTVTVSLISVTLILYTALTKLAIIAGEQAAFIDRNDINVPQIIFSWMSLGANVLTVATFVSAVLFISFARKRIYGCVYNWSMVADDK